jgi:hypothetical protein
LSSSKSRTSSSMSRIRMAMSAMRAYQSQRPSCEEGAELGDRAASAQMRATWRSMAARRAWARQPMLAKPTP